MKKFQRISSFMIVLLGMMLLLSSCLGSGSGSSSVNYGAKDDEKTNFNNLSENGWFELYKATDTSLTAEAKEALKDKKLADLSASQKAAFEAFRESHNYYLDIVTETVTENNNETTRKIYVIKDLKTGERQMTDKDGNLLFDKEGNPVYENYYEGGEKALEATYVIDGEEVTRPIVYIEMSDLGLKFIDDAESVGKKTLTTLETTADNGFLFYIFYGVGKGLSFINSIVPSYLFTLFIFAILVKILLFWFAIKQQRSMVKQAGFKPKERAIRNKYKGRDDRVTQQKMQEEIMEAQRAEGVSAFGGCLPMLIQLPVIMLLYQVIINPLRYVAGYASTLIDSLKKVLCYNSLEGLKLVEDTAKLFRSASPGSLTELSIVPVLRDNWSVFGTIPGMADKTADSLPNFYAFGSHIDLSVKPSFVFEWPTILYLLIPVITFVALYFSMKLNRKLTGAAQEPAGDGAPNMGAANKIMDLTMPALSTLFTFMFPALLGIYWIFNNLLGTAQQLLLNKMIPFPVFTEEDFKKAEREYKGKEAKKKPAEARVSDPNKPKAKSLHTIDDDDDEEYPDLPPIDENKEPVVEEKKKGKFSKASMKNDEDKPKTKDNDNNDKQS